MAEYVIYDTRECLRMEDDELDSIMRECGAVDSDESITDQQRWDYLTDLMNDQYDDLMQEIRYVSGEFLVIADLGLWDGHRHSWALCPSLETAIRKCLSGMDDFKIVEDGRGKVTITGYHHDGTNVYELRKVKPGYVAGNVSKSAIRHYTTNAHLRKTLGWI